MPRNVSNLREHYRGGHILNARKPNYRWWLLLMLMFLLPPAWGEDLLMIRVKRAFPEAMNAVQLAVKSHGYTVSRVQRVDVGLHASGFQTAEYRVVFFAKPDELHKLSARYPELIPYLPWQLVVIAEADDTLIVTANPSNLNEFFKHPELQALFVTWEGDVRAILDSLQQAK
jgi:uncharacterized protein (DUF302 family)